MNANKLNVFIQSLLFGCLLGFASVATADDTEVFFGNIASTGETLPNIMFVLDTSGSMARRDGGTETRLDRMKQAVIEMLDEDRDMNIGLMQYNGGWGGGPVLYPITNLPKLTCDDGDCAFATGPQSNTFEADGSIGDVQEQKSTGAVTTSGAELNLAVDENSLATVVGLRFSELNIARKSSILEARLEFVAVGSQIAESTLSVEIEKIDHAQPFDDSNNAVTGRTYDNSKKQEWIPDEWYDQTPYQSEDLSEMVQSVISRDDWCVGNSVSFKITGTDAARIAYSRDKAIADGVSYIPKLKIIQDPTDAVADDNCTSRTLVSRIGTDEDDAEQRAGGSMYNVGGTSLNTAFSTGGDQRQVMGLRFKNIMIPKDIVVEKAYVRLTLEKDTVGTLSGSWYAEDSTQPAAFDQSNASTSPMGSGRNYRSNPIAWNNIPARSAGETLDTVDLAPLIQAMVNDPDWDEGDPDNAINLRFLPTAGDSIGERDYKSFENNPSEAPQLFIVYQNAGSGATPAYTATTVTKLIGRYDDAEQDADGGGFNRSDYDIDLEYDGTNDTRIGGFRFVNVDVPAGATIDSAFMRLASHGSSSSTGAFYVTIYTEDSVNTVTYDSESVGPANRTYMSATGSRINWNTSDVWDKEVTVDTPDMGSQIQFLVNKPDWIQANNAIGFKFHPTWTWGGAKRSFMAQRAGASTTAELHVTYSMPAVAGTGAAGTGPGSAAPAYTGTSTGIPLASREARDDMIKIVNDLVAHSGTPTVDAFYEAALYMRGDDVDFGKRRGHPNTQATRADRRFFRISHEDSYTGGSVSRDARCIEGNMSSSRCRSENITGSPKYISPILGVCQANHIVLLSDGETNGNVSNPKKALSLIDDKNSCTVSGNEACATDLAFWLNNNDQMTGFGSLPGEQTITTHTIAYNLAGDGKDFLKDVADAGGGTAYEAASASDLLGIFNELVTNIVDTDTGFTAPAATVNQFNRLTHRDDLYFAIFKPGETAAWEGNVKRFRLGKDSNGEGEVVIRDVNGAPAIDQQTGLFEEDSHSWWPELDNDGAAVEADGNDVERGGAANQLSLKTNASNVDTRSVYTWLQPVGTQILETAQIDLTLEAHKLHEDNGLITDAMLDIVDKEDNSADQDAYREKLLKWARGVDVDDVDSDGSSTDIRRHMGDPMHSRPVVVNYADSSADDDIRSLLYVGTNEGFLHAFDTKDGSEEFAYIPHELLGNLNTFYENEQGYERTYGLDGPVSLWRDDANENGVIDTGDSAYLFVGMRRGGSHYYALNITDPDSPKLAWTIKGGTDSTDDFKHLGQSWSRMTPVKMFIENTEEDVLVFGGGYDPVQDNTESITYTQPTDSKGNGIYIVRATDGALLWSGMQQTDGNENESFPDMEYGFNSNIRTIDINRDGYVDQMYAADTGGQIWRFDLTQYHSSQSTDDLVAGGVIAELGGVLQRDQRRFYNEPDVALIEDNGERYLTVSIGSGWRAHPLDETTKDKFYVIKQYSVYEKPEDYGKHLGGSIYMPVQEYHLDNVTNDDDPDADEDGWFVELELTGEKVLGTSVTFGGKIIFTSYVPTTEVEDCSPESGSGRAYVLDAATGAPVVDFDKSSDDDEEDTDETTKVLTSSDRSTELARSGIPPEAMVMISKDSPDSPQILIGGEQLETGITNATRRTFWSDEGESGIIIPDDDENDNGDGNTGTEVSESDQG